MPRTDASRQRCAIYTRKSSEEGLEQEFNSLAAQCEACEAFIRSQRHEGWVLAKTRYDDGGFSGGNIERPALQDLIGDIRAGRIDIVVVYKVDRLTRSLADFARLVELFDAEAVSFVSVTQQFNTTSSARAQVPAGSWRGSPLAIEAAAIAGSGHRQSSGAAVPRARRFLGRLDRAS
jgi:site-specific DNA recombinase